MGVERSEGHLSFQKLTTRDRRQERHLIAVADRRIGPRVLVIHGQEHLGARVGASFGAMHDEAAIAPYLSTFPPYARYKVRIFHEPEDDDEAHAAVKSLPRDDMELLERLAAGAWADWTLNKTVQP